MDDDASQTKVVIQASKQRRAQLAADFAAVLGATTRQQFRLMHTRLDHKQARKGTRHWTYAGEPPTELKGLDTRYVVQVANETTDLADAVNHDGQEYAIDQAHDVARTVGKKLKMNTSDAHDFLSRNIGPNYPSIIKTAVVAPVVEVIRKASTQRAQKMADTLSQLDANGASMAQIHDAVDTMQAQNKTWTDTVANWASGAIVEGTSSVVLDAMHDKVDKVWHSMRDTKVRDTHRTANGQKADRNGNFLVGDAVLRFPGDPLASVNETAGCRCHVGYNLK